MENQIRDISGLGYLIDSGRLGQDLGAFLVACKVNELSPRTIDDYREKMGSFVRHCVELGVTEPSQVTVNHLRLFLLKLQERKARSSTIHDYYGTIKRFFNWMVDERLLEQNPFATMKPPRTPDTLIHPLRSQDIKLLLQLCDVRTFLGLRNVAIILTFLDTGLRLSEMAGIQIKDIDFNIGAIKIMGKGAKERLVGVGKMSQKILLQYLLTRNDKYSCLWVTEERAPLSALGIQTMIKRLGKRAGITGVRCSPHTFRHTFATTALKHGAGEFDVQSLLGHSTLTMTRRYAATLRSEEAVSKHGKFSPVDKLLK